MGVRFPGPDFNNLKSNRRNFSMELDRDGWLMLANLYGPIERAVYEESKRFQMRIAREEISFRRTHVDEPRIDRQSFDMCRCVELQVDGLSDAIALSAFTPRGLTTTVKRAINPIVLLIFRLELG